MAFLRIFQVMGWVLVFSAFLLLLTAASGLLLDEYDYARLYGTLALIVGVIGLIASLVGQNAPRHETTRDALVFLLFFWLLIPFVVSLPWLALAGHQGLARSWFEAVSALTTTGATSMHTDDLPQTLILWRALLQWSGGCMSASLAVVVLAALNLTGVGEHKSNLFLLERGMIFSRLFSILRSVAVIYAGVSVVGFIFLFASGTELFDAFCLSLSAVSTGGLTPRSGVLSEYVSGFGGMVLAILCVIGAANIALVHDVFTMKTRASLAKFFKDVELKGLSVGIAILVLFGFWATGPSNLFDVVLEAAYMGTTTGFDYHVIGIDMVSPLVLTAWVLIGGSALSTAGGLKIIRMLLLFRHMRTDMDRMILPRRVMPVKFQGRMLDDKAFLSVWMYFFGYTLAFGLGIVALGAAGLELTSAVTASASALSNTGPLLAATYPKTGYADMSNLQLVILSTIMLAGRLEVLAVFSLLSPSLWKN